MTTYMTLINMLFLGIVFAGLLMWMGNLVREKGEDERTGKDWLFFLLSGLGASIIAILISWSINEDVFNLSTPVLLSIIIGLTIALSLHLIQQLKMTPLKVAPLFIIFLLLLSWTTISNNWIFLLIIAGMGILTVLAWLGWDQIKKRHWIFFVIEVVLLGISIRVVDMNGIADMSPHWLGSIVSIISYLFIPWAGIVLSALLLRRLFSSNGDLHWRVVISTLLMVAILFLMIGYQAMLTSLWDVATDGLGWVLLLMTTSTIGIGSAMLMTWSMSRKQLWGAILFALTIPSVLVQAHNIANYDKEYIWGTKPIIITERRADHIDRAIQNYYVRNHEYPQTLKDLTPWYLLYIPNPYIIPGQDWCYEGSADFYRLGYVFREYFSTPASVRIHSSKGEPTTSNWECEDEAAPYSKPLGF